MRSIFTLCVHHVTHTEADNAATLANRIFTDDAISKRLKVFIPYVVGLENEEYDVLIYNIGGIRNAGDDPGAAAGVAEGVAGP